MSNPTNSEIRDRHITLSTWASAYGGKLPDIKPYYAAHEHRGILLDRLEVAEAELEAAQAILRERNND